MQARLYQSVAGFGHAHFLPVGVAIATHHAVNCLAGCTTPIDASALLGQCVDSVWCEEFVLREDIVSMMRCDVLCMLLLAVVLMASAEGATDMRLVDESGSVSSAGLLQVKTEAGFGTVCGANAAAADVS